MMNLISLAIAIIFFVIGFMIHNTWSSLFYSLGLIVVAAVASYNWVPLVEYVGPCQPENNSTFWKLVLTIILQLVAIYYASREYPILGAIALGFFVWGWLYVEPISHDGDAAGNGMAAGFSAIAYVVIALFLSILFYAIVKLSHRHEVLVICVTLLALFFVYNALLSNYYNRTSGKDAEYTARFWYKCSLQEYIIRTYREQMLEPNGLWMLKDVGLDHVKEEVDDKVDYGDPAQDAELIKYEISIKSHPLPVMLLDVRYKEDTDSIETIKLPQKGRYISKKEWVYPFFEENHHSILIRSENGSILINMVWADPLDRNVYTFSSTLDENDLMRYKSYFNNYNLQYYIASEGKVFLYISDSDEIHSSLIGCVGTGVKSDDYNELLKKKCDEDNLEAAFDKVGNYIKEYDRWSWNDFSLNYLENAIYLPDRFKDRVSDTFNYQVKFEAVEGEYTMEKMGLLFFDKDKCIEKEMDLQKRPRVKDFFSIWKVGGRTYIAFLFFDVEEMVRVFKEAYGNDPMQEGCLKIKLGKKQKKNEITLTVSGKTYPIENVEMKVYSLVSDKCDLLYKNYEGNHKNELGCGAK
ncbi:MAG: CvpA family protein [Paludibacteraceae bacterium]|nr:CvpA family protein [Paludibacteraceae bacterium]